MTVSPLAGKPAPKEMLIDPARLEREYFERRPDPDDHAATPGSAHRARPQRAEPYPIMPVAKLHKENRIFWQAVRSFLPNAMLGR